ncbi:MULTISPECIES: hypothetical protein [Oceanobacillus]|uniref:hypothetical protein n=1 Tax=Oceanobacillus TaxID=182709 RepID=UPI000596039E|nr:MULTISPECIES: hypothetical protein [Oceanobacillus]
MPQLINVQFDSDWVSRHISNEIESNAGLKVLLYEWLAKQNLDLNRLKEIYHNALINGHIECKFLSFSNWFYNYALVKEEESFG